LLRVEELDRRVVPSATLPTLPGAAAATPLPSPTLFGNLHGQWKAEAPHPDVGTTSDLTGLGDLAGVGPVTVAGAVTGVGMIANGHAAGTLTITGSGGTVTLKLTGPSQPGFAALPDGFDYTVTGGTGNLATLQSQGRVYLHLATDGSFTLAIRPANQAPPTVRSGVRGLVTLGPIAPMEKPGVPNTQPLPGALVSIHRHGDGNGTEIAHMTTDRNGAFYLPVDPGTYTITVTPPGAHGDAHRYKGTVVVKAGQFTRLDVTIDSGIR
jgi:hypothetical protein